MKLRNILTALLLLIATGASARGYNNISAAWHHKFNSATMPMMLDSKHLNGASIKYLRGISLSESDIFFIEVGAQFSALFGKRSVDLPSLDPTYNYVLTDKRTMSLFTAQVPVNFAYRLPLSNTIAFTPYTGLHLNVHMAGTVKEEVTVSGDKVIKEDFGSDSYNIFKNEDMGGTGNYWSRVQVGWQIGVRFNFSAFSLGAEYNIDYNRPYTASTSSDVFISLGATF